ncbi:ester cyclase [Dactylosporangium darangshiense]|uniref:SnoaL-like domain-containing protein n=1 Tax=Dactylosporangium darangshiense TaxID=579108 RepID=A0ABP8DIR5_9ACTN
MDVVLRYFDMWNTGDTSIAEQVLHPAWVDHAHPEVAGPDGVRQSVMAIRAARPGLRFTVHSVLGDEDLVAVVGSVGEAPGDGSPGKLVWLVRLADGLMAEMWTYQQSGPR